jgi:hypothetical protein
MKRAMQMMMVVFGLGLAGTSEARTLRATEMSSTLWAELMAGEGEGLVVEFRQGDQLPVNFSAKGDLLETVQPGLAYVNVKRGFWLKLERDELLMSLDGQAFRPLKESVAGGLSAGAGSEENGGIVNAITVALKAYLK